MATADDLESLTLAYGRDIFARTQERGGPVAVQRRVGSTNG